MYVPNENTVYTYIYITMEACTSTCMVVLLVWWMEKMKVNNVRKQYIYIHRINRTFHGTRTRTRRRMDEQVEWDRMASVVTPILPEIFVLLMNRTGRKKVLTGHFSTSYGGGVLKKEVG